MKRLKEAKKVCTIYRLSAESMVGWLTYVILWYTFGKLNSFQSTEIVSDTEIDCNCVCTLPFIYSPNYFVYQLKII